MKEKTYFLNSILVIVLAVTLFTGILLRTFFPMIVLPKLNIPNMVIICLVALLLEHYLVAGKKHCYVCIFVLATITFGILPWAAGFIEITETIKVALVGGSVFTIITALFGSIQNRLSSGPASKLAPILSAVGLYLASQSMMGMIL